MVGWTAGQIAGQMVAPRDARRCVSCSGSVDPMPTLLMVDDDAAHRRALAIGLGARGYELIEAGDGHTARAAVEARRPDLVLLDLGLPDIDGVDLCRHLHIWPAAPIIVVSADADDRRMLQAFDVGADDYVVKPVVLDVLAARIAVHLRHAEQAAPTLEPVVLSIGDVRLDTAAHEVEVGGEPLWLRPQQFTILAMLMRNAGRLVTHDVLARALGGGVDEPHRNAVRITIHRLRTALGSGPDRPQIVTERHIGYRLVPSD
jgi:two-component system KDP operon response regulator KdpE